MSKAKPKRGGSREGAGRPTSDGAVGMTRRTVMLDGETYERLLAIGAGNLSAGVRLAAREYEIEPEPTAADWDALHGRMNAK